MPVPMLTLNQLGVKCIVIRRSSERQRCERVRVSGGDELELELELDSAVETEIDACVIGLLRCSC